LYQYAFGHGPGRVNRRIQYGTFPDLSPAKARSIAAELAARVKLGEDPAAQKRVARSELRNTFGRLVTAYLESKKSELRDSSYTEIARYLDRQAKPLHGLPTTAIDLKKIANLLDTIADDSGPVSANRARTALSGLFSWSMRKGLHDRNPVISSEVRKEQSRDRVLTDHELATVWNAVGDTEYGVILKLLILTAQRASEIGGLRWSEIDFDRGVISLPGERTKNGRPHEIPMSDAVVGILQARSRDQEHVFGRGVGFGSWGKSKARLDKALPLPHWTVHDLRRTAATRMADLGGQPHVIEAILNHVSGHRAGVAGIYNRSLYKTEKAQALAKWATHVLAIAKGKKSNITPMRRGA
jgi:integrase